MYIYMCIYVSIYIYFFHYMIYVLVQMIDVLLTQTRDALQTGIHKLARFGRYERHARRCQWRGEVK